MNALKRHITSFNHYPVQTCILHRPERYRELSQLSPTTIARGQGRSYGDAALNENNHVVLTERLNRFVEFDPINGTLTAEAGITLAEVLNLIIPHDWFLPVTPGTQYVSLGGCVAADVHGKNHHRVGSFGQHVLWLELITANGETIRCSTKQNSHIYWATVGGMGLTGIIGTVSVKLIPIKSTEMAVTHRASTNLEKTFDYLAAKDFNDDYSVAWIDTFNIGRSIVMTAHHVNESISKLKNIRKNNLTIPFNCPNLLLNKTTLKIFNQLYFKKQSQKTSPFKTELQNYFYPLDRITHWNRLYGKRGFVQYQCVIPNKHALVGTQKILEALSQSAYPSFLGVLKRFSAENLGLLSFPMAGFTLALDIPILDNGLFKVLDQLDEIVLTHGGRVYLAKDARLKPETFRAMYPKYNEWLAIKNKIDPNNIFSSSLSRRLKIA